MKIEFLHHWQATHGLRAAGPADRAPAALRAVAQRACRGCSTCATACRCCARADASSCSASPRSARCRAGGATRSSAARAPARERPPRRRRRRRAASSTRSPTTSSRRTRTPRCACCSAAGYHGARRTGADDGARPLCCGRTYPRQPAWSTRRSAKRGALVDALLPFVERGVADRRPRAVVPADVARRVPGRWASAQRRRALARQRAAVRGVPRARGTRPGG